jgi:3-dehydroquinate dehydratase/shikimate dehydrogenase
MFRRRPTHLPLTAPALIFLMDPPHKPRICISVCEATVAALQRSLAAAAEVCDLIEVRLDCLTPAELETGASLITTLLEKSSCQTILTFRPVEQGGRRPIKQETRRAFWSSAIFSESFFDVELDLVEELSLMESSPPLPIDWSRTVCSHHDFRGVPRNLDEIYERLASTPARVLKIAVLANDATDCISVFNLLRRAGKEGREMIAIAMGPAGIATRILGPSRGAFLTYASPEGGTVTAPGQISAGELRDVYRLEEIDQQTEIFGLVGLPVSHSVSPHLHNAAFAAAGLNAVYLPFEVHDVKAFIKRMIHPKTRELDWNIHGLSITAPHKSAVLTQLDWIEPAAQEIEAVNTILIEDNELRGYNTDVLGFVKPLVRRFGDLREARCAVLGAGGAASAALSALRRAGAKPTLFARNDKKANLLAARFGITWMKLGEASFAGFDVVINATPLGSAGQFENKSPATTQQLRGARLAYDLVYNPTETKFLREAREAGCETLGGLEMLVSQATEQFRLWTGGSVPETVMYEAAQRGLEEDLEF